MANSEPPISQARRQPKPDDIRNEREALQRGRQDQPARGAVGQAVPHFAEAGREHDDGDQHGTGDQRLERTTAQALRLELAGKLLEAGYGGGDVVVGRHPLSIA
jgi:hypothetical protein